jgi:hypothetical protein
VLDTQVTRAVGLKSAPAVFALNAARQAYAHEYFDAMRASGVHALLGPATALPAFTHGGSRGLTAALSYTMIYNLVSRRGPLCNEGARCVDSAWLANVACFLACVCACCNAAARFAVRYVRVVTLPVIASYLYCAQQLGMPAGVLHVGHVAPEECVYEPTREPRDRLTREAKLQARICGVQFARCRASLLYPYYVWQRFAPVEVFHLI